MPYVWNIRDLLETRRLKVVARQPKVSRPFKVSGAMKAVKRTTATIGWFFKRSSARGFIS